MRNHKITAYQNTSMLILSSFIFQILVLPVLITKTNGPTAWISIVIAMFIGILFIKPICKIQEKRHDKTLLDICNDLMPTLIVKIIGTFYIVFFIVASSILLKDFSEQVKIFMLPRTPNNLVILIILLTSSYAAHKGIVTIAQVAHLTVIITLIPLLLVTIFSTSNATLSNIFPIWPLDFVGILKGVPFAFAGFFGFYILLFSNPYVRKYKVNNKQNKTFFILSSAIYILCFFLVMFKFGYGEARRLVFPFNQILKFLNIPGSFIENLEALGMSLSTVCAFVCLSIILYFTNLSLQKTLKTEEDSYFIFIQTPIIYILACILPGINIVLKYIHIPIYIFSAINILVILSLIVLDKKRSMAK
ncbi:GerAB/ArcD/ProY family transporter [Sedimentibacter sp. zth1]|uniref:GerAB/ArcD/ProY family transporter n=1 Tax=Sedimentibacter sp. zth1 TaxID=2816908 RepID=UPI001A93052B|nr:GerAB/ArcD/ProY family transporter [Sedimentibacter sp. zth1]QSX05244.1 GerAB/ArcD/ProY family transporter [Sedimentibacter sp. zth1]